MAFICYYNTSAVIVLIFKNSIWFLTVFCEKIMISFSVIENGAIKQLKCKLTKIEEL